MTKSTEENILVKYMKNKNILLDGDQIYHVNKYGILRPYSNFDFKIENDASFNCGNKKYIDLQKPDDESDTQQYKKIYDYISDNRQNIMGHTIQLEEQCGMEGKNIEYQKSNDSKSDSTYSLFAYIDAKGGKSDYRDRQFFLAGDNSDQCPSGAAEITAKQFSAPKNTGYYADKKPFCQLHPKRKPSEPTPNFYPGEAYGDDDDYDYDDDYEYDPEYPKRNTSTRNREYEELPPYQPHSNLDRKYEEDSYVRPDFSKEVYDSRDEWNLMTSQNARGMSSGRRYNRGYDNGWQQEMMKELSNMPFLAQANREIGNIHSGLYMRVILWSVLLIILISIITKVRRPSSGM